MRRGIADIVPMPLPTQWGPTVIPPGVTPNGIPPALLSLIPPGSQIGWQQVLEGWILAILSPSGQVTIINGASVVPYPGAQDPAFGSSNPGTVGSPAFGGQSPTGDGGSPSNYRDTHGGGYGTPGGGEFGNGGGRWGSNDGDWNANARGRANPADQWGRGQSPNRANGGGNGGGYWDHAGNFHPFVAGSSGNPGGLMVSAPTTGPVAPASSTFPGNIWGHQPIIPDSMLPPVLQRSNPLLGREVILPPNAFDLSLRKSAARWAYIRSHGGLKSCCRVPELGAPIYQQDPRSIMPSQAEPFQKMFGIPTDQVSGGGPFTGNDTVLGSFQVPLGYDGVMNRFVCTFTGTGFLDFMGLITWRVLVNNRYARNLGAVQNTYGDFKTSFMVPGQDIIRLISGQTVTLIANIPTGSPVADGVVAAGAFGWFYPRR